MQSLTRSIDLEYLINKYDLFVLDLCGILHDDLKIFPDSLATVKYIQSKDKKILFLSNSPRPSSHVKYFLEQQGLVFREEDKIVTSYDYFAYCVSHNRNLRNKNYFNLGQNPSIGFIDGIRIVDKLEDADYLAISLFKKEDGVDTGLEWKDILYKAESLKLKGICINPDFIAPYGKMFRYTPGYFAHFYESIGGKIEYFGKPVLGIYEFALGNNLTNKKNMLAMGDSLKTDIAGAKAFGIDSVLVYDKGVHKVINFKDSESIEKLFEQNKVRPTYILPFLSLDSVLTLISV